MTDILDVAWASIDGRANPDVVNILVGAFIGVMVVLVLVVQVRRIRRSK